MTGVRESSDKPKQDAVRQRPSGNGRLMSLDTLRGADMFVITGLTELVMAVCTAMGCPNCWLAMQFEHAPWHGMHFDDTVFPLFLFLAGVSWPFSYAKRRERGSSTGAIVCKVLLRMLCLIVLAFTTAQFFRFEWRAVRWNSVLTHIGICWAVAAFVYMFVGSAWKRLAIATMILVGYWLLLKNVLAPDQAALLNSTDPRMMATIASYAQYGTDGFSFTGNLAGWVERTFNPGWKFEVGFDPDGLLAKIPGVVTAMLGMFAGDFLRCKDFSGSRKTALLLGAGTVCLVVCLAWMPWCPVNKKIWTSTFILASGAYSFVMLAVFYWVIDVKCWRGWTFFFRVIGANAITVYVMRRFFDCHFTSRFFLSGIAALLPGGWGDVLLWVGYIAAWWLVLLVMYRKNIFLRV